MVRSKLNPPCVGWRQDLPGPNESLGELPFLIDLLPTHLDEFFLELPRNTSIVRGLALYGSIVMGVVSIHLFVSSFLFFCSSYFYNQTDFVERIWLILVSVFCFILFVWVACLFYRLDVSPPRNLPLRFNRPRRKVYVYDFSSVSWNPFANWYVTTASYNWDDLRAEKWKIRSATSGGVLIIKEGISIAVVKPGTNDVITRFDLGTTAANTTNLWAYVCSYMQSGVEGLDPDHVESRDVNDVAPYNLALRLAPKVEWPADMDHESRTAP